jgi:hypothetical protein
MSVIASGHLADGTLLSIMDDESPLPAGAREHLSGCVDCVERFSALKRAEALLPDAFAASTLPTLHLRLPARRRSWLASFPATAAATLLILASGAAATPGIRRWIITRASPAAARVEDLPPKSGKTAAASGGGILVSFTPTDTMLLIRVDRAQATGEIYLVGIGGSKAAAQAVGGMDAGELLVLPSAIRVVNGAASTADYRISVPPFVRMVRIVIAETETAVVVNDGRLDRRIPLR